MKQGTLEKIQNLAVSLQLVTVEDMRKHSLPQLVTMIANKLNELMNEVQRFETDVIESVKTQNDKIQYLLGEGLHLEVCEVFDTWMNDGTFDTLINQTALKTVNDRIDETNAQLLQVTHQISDFPRLASETTDYNRFIRAFDSMKNGDRLLLLNEEYDLGGNDLVLNKRITLYSNTKPFYNRHSDVCYGATLKNGGVVFEENGITIKNIGVYCPSLDNGFECSRGQYHDLLIEDCFSIARDHSYLFESYTGEVRNVNVIRCYASKSIHGFISKAFNVNFINCIAERVTSFGFGNISDNMSSFATQMALNYDNSVIDCHAFGCGVGFIAYSRDKSNDDSESRVINLKYINCSTNTCTTPMKLGERDVPSGYRSIRAIDSVTVDNFVSYYSSSTHSIQFENINQLSLGEYIVDKPFVINNISTMPDKLKKERITVLKFASYADEITISSSENDSYELQARADDADIDLKTIKIVANPSSLNNKLTIFVRSNQGNPTIGGFTGDCVVPTSLNLTLTFGVGLLTEWVYYESLGKYLCVHTENIKYD